MLGKNVNFKDGHSIDGDKLVKEYFSYTNLSPPSNYYIEFVKINKNNLSHDKIDVYYYVDCIKSELGMDFRYKVFESDEKYVTICIAAKDHSDLTALLLKLSDTV